MQPHCSFEHAHRIPITIALALTAPTTPFPPMRKQAHSCSGLHFFTLDAKMHVFARSCLGVDRTGATACIHHGHSSCIRSNAGARGASHSFGTGSRKHRQTHTHTPCFAAKVSRGVQVRPPTPFCTPFIRGKKGVATYSYLWVSSGAGRERMSSWLASQAQNSRLCSSYAMRPAGQSVAV
jgi:hypothetical protein